jgi:hypothetical protein
MAKTFEVGDHVSWNSEAGRVRGRILRVASLAFAFALKGGQVTGR